MPVEEAAIGGILRVIVWLVMEIFLQSICWSVGWATLKMFTLGNYPKQSTKSGHVIAIGLIVLISAGVAFTFALS